METPVIAHSSQLDKARHKGEEFMRNLEKLSSQLQTDVEEDEPHPKRHKTQSVPQQAQEPEAPVAQIEHIPQQVLREEQPT